MKSDTIIFSGSILIEQRIGPPGNFTEFCTKSFCLLTLRVSLFNNFLGLTLKSNNFFVTKEIAVLVSLPKYSAPQIAHH